MSAVQRELSGANKQLVHKGYLYRQDITSGRTAKQLALTEAGSALLPRLYREITHVLSNQEIAMEDGALGGSC